MTVAKRVAQLLENGRVKSVRRWCSLAGISGSSLRIFLSRAKTDPTVEMLPSTLVALARAAGVSPAWLLLGVGTPDDVETPAPSPRPNLEALLARHPGRWAPGAVAQARALAVPGDLDEAAWADVLTRADVALRVALADLPRLSA